MQTNIIASINVRFFFFLKLATYTNFGELRLVHGYLDFQIYHIVKLKDMPTL